jgi:hypothetical protein
MQKARLPLFSVLIFCLCCSMSQCMEDKTPGPVTTVRGFVRENKTGAPMAGVQLQIVKFYSVFLDSHRVSYYNITTTRADGSYDLRFTPLGKGQFYLQVLNPPRYYIEAGEDPAPSYPDNGLILGGTDTLNFKFTKLLGLTVHLTNKSSQNRKAFWVWILDDDASNPGHIAYGDGGFSHPVVDTTIIYHLPQLNSYTYKSIFYNPILSGPNVGGFSDSLSFQKNFYLGKADTSLVIVNP